MQSCRRMRVACVGRRGDPSIVVVSVVVDAAYCCAAHPQWPSLLGCTLAPLVLPPWQYFVRCYNFSDNLMLGNHDGERRAGRLLCPAGEELQRCASCSRVPLPHPHAHTYDRRYSRPRPTASCRPVFELNRQSRAKGGLTLLTGNGYERESNAKATRTAIDTAYFLHVVNFRPHQVRGRSRQPIRLLPARTCGRGHRGDPPTAADWYRRCTHSRPAADTRPSPRSRSCRLTRSGCCGRWWPTTRWCTSSAWCCRRRRDGEPRLPD